MYFYGVPSIFGPPITSYPGWSMELEDIETVKSWRIGQQLVYTLLIEAHHPGHNDGIPTFYQLMADLAKYIKDEESITSSDVNRMFDIIIKENKPTLLAKVINNPLLPDSNYDGRIAKKAL